MCSGVAQVEGLQSEGSGNDNIHSSSVFWRQSNQYGDCDF